MIYHLLSDIWPKCYWLKRCIHTCQHHTFLLPSTTCCILQNSNSKLHIDSVNIVADWNRHWIRTKDNINNEFPITLYLVGSMECIGPISLLHQENIMQHYGWIEAWHLISLQYSSFKSKLSKWPLLVLSCAEYKHGFMFIKIYVSCYIFWKEIQEQTRSYIIHMYATHI